jgi:transcriptional regulator with XRE-family HTH domain
MTAWVRSSPASTFAELLREYRLAAGLSQQELAERAGMSVRGISDLERGVRRRPWPGTARRLADALNLDAADRAALCGSAQPDGAFSAGGPPRCVGRLVVPAPPTPLLGREREVGAVARLLARSDVRLVTLTGPGGVG